MFSPGSLWADNCPSFQPGLGEAQLCGSLGLGSRNFLSGLSTVRISCLFSLKGKPWKRGRLFPSWSLPQSSGGLPGGKHGIHKAVKNNPSTEQKAWERGWPGDFARGWERWVRRGNLYPETLGRVLFQKSYAGSEGLRPGKSALTASFQEECPLEECLAGQKGAAGSGRVLPGWSLPFFSPECQPRRQRSEKTSNRTEATKRPTGCSHWGCWWFVYEDSRLLSP